jgi:hypothetical protein
MTWAVRMTLTMKRTRYKCPRKGAAIYKAILQGLERVYSSANNEWAWKSEVLSSMPACLHWSWLKLCGDERWFSMFVPSSEAAASATASVYAVILPWRTQTSGPFPDSLEQERAIFELLSVVHRRLALPSPCRKGAVWGRQWPNGCELEPGGFPLSAVRTSGNAALANGSAGCQ